MKALNNRFYVKFIQLGIGLLDCKFNCLNSVDNAYLETNYKFQ